MHTEFKSSAGALVAIFFCGHCLAQSALEVVPDCESDAAVRRVIESIGDRTDELTIKKRAQAKQTFELARVVGPERGRDEQQQRAILQESFALPDYLALEEKKSAFQRAALSIFESGTKRHHVCRSAVPL